MSYKNPKLDWKASDVVLNVDFNRIEGNIDYLKGKSDTLEEGLVPSGLISMWSGAINAIPTGWLLCNGNNGTPDLRDRFVVGAGKNYEVGDVGGESNTTLTISQIPSHSHTKGTLAISSGGGHSHRMTVSESGSSNSGPGTWRNTGDNSTISTSYDGSHSHSLSGELNSTGGGESHENRPPYFALAYIMKS